MKYFGMIAEKTGVPSESLKLAESISLSDLQKILQTKYTKLEKVPYTFAVNMEVISDEDYRITTDCEIALLPAFAGG